MFTICSLYVHYMFTICSLYVHYKWISLSYTQCDTCKIYKKLAPLTQERSHCIRNCIYLFTICSLYVHYKWISLSYTQSDTCKIYKKLAPLDTGKVSLQKELDKTHFKKVVS